MKHRLPALLAAFVCMFGLMLGSVASAWADDPTTYDLWVSGTQVTSENADDVLGDGTVSFAYDAESKTGELTLNGANLTAAYFPDGYGYPTTDAGAIFVSNMNLDIILVGDNTISNGDKLSDGGYVFGVFSGYHESGSFSSSLELTFAGDGTLAINMTPRGKDAAGVYGTYHLGSTFVADMATVAVSIEGGEGAVEHAYGVSSSNAYVFPGATLAVDITGRFHAVQGIYSSYGPMSPGIVSVHGTVSIAAEASGYAYGIYGNTELNPGALLDIELTSEGSQGITGSSLSLSSNTQTRVILNGEKNEGHHSAIDSSSVTIYEGAVLEAQGIDDAFGTAPNIESYPEMTALVGKTAADASEWDGTTPLGGEDTPYSYVRIPGTPAQIERIAGDYANETSAQISAKAFPEGSEYVVIARDDDFADALGATGLAGTLDCPIVLTDRMELSEAAAAEITRLGAKHAYIIGGTGAIKEQVDADLAELGVTVEPRIWGENSYDTSLACAKMIEELSDFPVNNAVIAMSTNFQDALSFSPIAYRNDLPVILQTWGDTSADRGFTDEAAAWLEGKTLTVIGGTGAISEESVADYDQFVRLWGETGYDTSNEIAKWATSRCLLDRTNVVIACGAQAPKGVDALAGAALAGQLRAPILLVNGNEAIEGVDTTTLDGYLAMSSLSVRNAYVLGGTYVIPEDLYNEVAALIGAE